MSNPTLFFFCVTNVTVRGILPQYLCFIIQENHYEETKDIIFTWSIFRVNFWI